MAESTSTSAGNMGPSKQVLDQPFGALSHRGRAVKDDQVGTLEYVSAENVVAVAKLTMPITGSPVPQASSRKNYPQ